MTYGTPEEAQAAVDSMNDQDLDGRNIRVNIAQEREERGGFQPRGGRGRGGYFFSFFARSKPAVSAEASVAATTRAASSGRYCPPLSLVL